MASAWGKSWDLAFGAAWGVVTQVLPPTPPSTFPGSSAPMRGKASHATMRAKEDVKATGRSKLKREDDLILLQF